MDADQRLFQPETHQLRLTMPDQNCAMPPTDRPPPLFTPRSSSIFAEIIVLPPTIEATARRLPPFHFPDAAVATQSPSIRIAEGHDRRQKI